MQGSKPDPVWVANEFVRRYYEVLAKHPRYLNRFYKEESQFTLTWRNHGRPDTRETVSTTQLIQDKVNSTVQGANITVEHTEVQYSLGSGILLQVDGRLTLPEEAQERRYTQIFFLAPQDKGFYVLNDILCLHPTIEGPAGAAAAIAAKPVENHYAAAPPAVVPMPGQPPVQVPAGPAPAAAGAPGYPQQSPAVAAAQVPPVYGTVPDMVGRPQQAAAPAVPAAAAAPPAAAPVQQAAEQPAAAAPSAPAAAAVEQQLAAAAAPAAAEPQRQQQQQEQAQPQHQQPQQQAAAQSPAPAAAAPSEPAAPSPPQPSQPLTYADRVRQAAAKKAAAASAANSSSQAAAPPSGAAGPAAAAAAANSVPAAAAAPAPAAAAAAAAPAEPAAAPAATPAAAPSSSHADAAPAAAAAAGGYGAYNNSERGPAGSSDRPYGPPGGDIDAGSEAMGIFLRGIPSTTTREELKERFGTYGNVVSVTIMPSRTHETYTAYVDFDSEGAAQKALADFPAGTFLKLGNTNASVLPKVPKQQRMLGGPGMGGPGRGGRGGPGGDFRRSGSAGAFGGGRGYGGMEGGRGGKPREGGRGEGGRGPMADGGGRPMGGPGGPDGGRGPRSGDGRGGRGGSGGRGGGRDGGRGRGEGGEGRGRGGPGAV